MVDFSYSIKNRLFSVALVTLLMASGCKVELGVPGTTLNNPGGTFTGLKGATVLSPSTIKLTWNTSSSYTGYQVFSSFSSAPIATTVFGSYTLNGLTPNTQYSFSIGGSSKAGSVDGLSVNSSVTTWPLFTGVSSATASSPQSLLINWSFPSGPTFNVYVTTALPTLNDFASPTATTTANTIGIAQLADGTPIKPSTTYYVTVRATFLDSTTEFNTNSVQVSTPTDINPVPTVAIDSVTFGKNATASVTNALSTYTTTLKLGSTTLANLSGSTSGFKFPSSIAAGLNTITATVTQGSSTLALPSLVTTSRNLIDTMFEYPKFDSSGRGYQRMGSAMTVGDFNCDGFQDLAVGAPYGTFNPLRAAQGNGDGGVYIFYGSTGGTGLITSPAPAANAVAPNPLLLTRPFYQSLAQTTPNPYSTNFGYSLAAGNINGDTATVGGTPRVCDDLVIGSNVSAGVTGYPASGEVWVFFGSTTGLQTQGLAANTEPCNNSGCSPLIIFPSSFSGTPRFGRTVAVGKVHMPGAVDSTESATNTTLAGFHDIIIGAPTETIGAPNNTVGATYIYYGTSLGVNFATVLPNSNVLSQGTKPYTKIIAPVPPQATGAATTTPGYRTSSFVFGFGSGIAALDMNNDGVDDLAISNPLDNVNGVTNTSNSNTNSRGRIYYYASGSYAAPCLFPAKGCLQANMAATSLITPVPPRNATATVGVGSGSNSERFGGILAKAGDLNGDNYEDLIVGEGADSGAAINSFMNGFYVYYGGASGPQHLVTAGSEPNLGIQIPMLTTGSAPPGNSGTAGSICNSNAANTACNWVVNAVVSCNTSTTTSICANGDTSQGPPNCGVGGSTAPGFVIAAGTVGNPNCYPIQVRHLGYTNSINSSGVSSGTTQGFVTVFGANAAGKQDVNGDGRADVVVGWPMTVASNSSMIPRSDVYYGQTTGLSVNPPSTFYPTVATDFDGLGWSVALGNFKGGVVSDVAVGLPSNMTLNGPYGGVVAILNGIQGQALPNKSQADQMIVANSSKEVRTIGLTNTTMNHTIPIGDINNDGYSDVAATLYRAQTVRTSGHATTGEQDLVIFYGSSNGLLTTMAPSYSPINQTDPLLVPPPTMSTYPQFAAVYPAGDVNGDGSKDIVVQSTYLSNGPEIVVYYGSSNGLNTANAPVVPPTLSALDPVVVAVNNSAQVQMGFGGFAPQSIGNDFSKVVTFGDFNGDQFSDIAIGNWTGNGANGCAANTGPSLPYNNTVCQTGGHVVIVYGSVSGPQTDGRLLLDNQGGTAITSALVAAPGNQVCSGTVPNLTCKAQRLLPLTFGDIGTGNRQERFGQAIVNVGDVNGDGYQDLLVGAPATDLASNQGQDSGAVYLFYGSPQGLLNWNGTQSGMLLVPPNISNTDTRVVGEALGYGGDINGDGFADLVIPSTRDDRAASNFGGAYVYYGCGNGGTAIAQLGGSVVGPLTPGCPPSGLWGVTEVANHEVLAASVAVNTTSCTAAGCQPLFFYPTGVTAIAGSSGNNTDTYWGSMIGSPGDMHNTVAAISDSSVTKMDDIVIGSYAINQPCSTSGCLTSTAETGAAILFSGSASGLVVNQNVTKSPTCQSGSCSPFWVTPSMTNWGVTGASGQPSFNLFTLNTAFGFPLTSDFNGDGYPDFIINSGSLQSTKTSASAVTNAFTGGFYVFQ